MKTVGQLLHSARVKKNISLDELSRLTKIDSRHIAALESDEYHLLPTETFVKGFIRNISLSLDCDPEELIAVFRRDFKQPENHPRQPAHFSSDFTRRTTLSYSRLAPLIVGVVVFLVYLGFQFRAIIVPPKLTIGKPLSGAVLSSPVDIQGTTSADSYLTINGDSVIRPDQEGKFQFFLNLPVGETSLVIKATNRFSN